jgi:hypothetical protein
MKERSWHWSLEWWWITERHLLVHTCHQAISLLGQTVCQDSQCLQQIMEAEYCYLRLWQSHWNKSSFSSALQVARAITQISGHWEKAAIDLALACNWIVMIMLVQCWKLSNKGSENCSFFKKEQKGSKTLEKCIRGPWVRKKPEDSQNISMALFRRLSWGMPGMVGTCLKCQECLGTMKFLVIHKFLPHAGSKLLWPSMVWPRTYKYVKIAE